jgi:6-phosphogluconolactonase
MREKRDIIIMETPEALAERGASVFVERARASVAARGIFMVALSGGSTPRRMHRLLGRESLCSEIFWRRTHIFWGDERCVPAESRDSNYGLARKDFLMNVDIPVDHIHPMPADVEPERGASLYEDEIPEILDLIFLGLGKDGHTASLFPGQSALEEKRKRVLAVKGGDPDVYRLTMTFPLINRAREVVFLVSGEEKAGIVKTVLEEPDTKQPAGSVKPVNGRLTWILDRDAASRLSEEAACG